MLNVFIADDEELARSRLRKLLTPFVKDDRIAIQGEANDGRSVLDQLPELDVDVLFLDIQMPELDGFDVLTELPKDDRPAIIFTTAFDRYALQAFEENAVDYLLKPISRERLDESLARVENARQKGPIDQDRLQHLIDWLEQGDLATNEDEYPEHISVTTNDRIRIIPLRDVLSVEIDEGITRVYQIDKDSATGATAVKHHVIDYTLDYLEDTLNPDQFIRVHRSAIVQVRHIEEMVPWFSGRYKLLMRGEHDVIASRKRSKELKELLTV